MALGLVFLCHVPEPRAGQNLFEGYRKIIVLDPGHGGQDSGAKGPDQTLEKKVALELAGQIAAELESEFKVVLTRTDDYHVALHNRTAMANHLKANLFISIHTAAGFTHSTSGTAIYYYRNFNGTDTGREADNPKRSQKSNRPILWKNIQLSHIKKSQALAGRIADRLENTSEGHIQVEGAPLAVLQGADMPAVLIEIGHLTNPADEKKLRDSRYLIELAGQISRGIEEFLE
jgi:N-acetylmuramoyl-L-alanine amidase